VLKHLQYPLDFLTTFEGFLFVLNFEWKKNDSEAKDGPPRHQLVGEAEN
jgi:hypothetical protein